MAWKKGLQSWQSKSPKEGYVPISRSLRLSDAFSELTGNQMRLYFFAESRWHFSKSASKKDRELHPEKYPIATWPDYPKITEDCFFLNWKLVMVSPHNPYGLYSEGNKKAFYKDVGRLIELGFFDKIVDGHGSSMKYVKSVYCMSERWKTWKKTVSHADSNSLKSQGGTSPPIQAGEFSPSKSV